MRLDNLRTARRLCSGITASFCGGVHLCVGKVGNHVTQNKIVVTEHGATVDATNDRRSHCERRADPCARPSEHAATCSLFVGGTHMQSELSEFIFTMHARRSVEYAYGSSDSLSMCG